MEQKEQELKKALLLAQEENNEKIILLNLKLLEEFYEENSNFKEALNLFKQFHTLELNFTNRELEEKKKDLLDSIRYAYRIQTAISPPNYLVNDLLPEHFILYMPKDVVSGDFYFVSEFKDTVLFAAVD